MKTNELVIYLLERVQKVQDGLEKAKQSIDSTPYDDINTHRHIFPLHQPVA